ADLVAGGVADLLDAGLRHHLAGGVAVLLGDLGAFLEAAARAFAVVGAALVIDIRAADAAGRRVGDHLLADHDLGPVHGVGYLLDDRLLAGLVDRVRDLLDDGIGHFLADGVGHLLVDDFLAGAPAGDLLADGVAVPDLLAADLVGLLGGALDPLGLRAAGLV